MANHAAGDTQAGSRLTASFRPTALASATNVTSSWKGARSLGVQDSVYPRDLLLPPTSKPFGATATSMPYTSDHTARRTQGLDRTRSRYLTWAADRAEAGRAATRKEDLRRTLTGPKPEPRPGTDKSRPNAISYGMRFGNLGYPHARVFTTQAQTFHETATGLVRRTTSDVQVHGPKGESSSLDKPTLVPANRMTPHRPTQTPH